VSVRPRYARRGGAVPLEPDDMSLVCDATWVPSALKVTAVVQPPHFDAFV
jgi:hypothetical protein